MTGGAEIDDFLREQFRRTEGLIYVCALRNNKSKLQSGEVAHIVTRSPNEVQSFCEKWDRPEHECGIYYHTATLKPGAARRITQNCHHFISLFSDVDDANHEFSRDKARDLLEQAEYPPTLIVDSGHGLQAYWLLTEPCTDADRIEKARKAIQNITASDNVADAARVMRLVGSHNSKQGNGEWLEVAIVRRNPECRYRLEDLEHWFKRAPNIIPRKPEENPEAKPKHNGAARRFYDDVSDLDVVREALRFIPNDDREDWRNVGMALNDAYGDAGFAVWAEWSASSAKYDAADQDKNWRSFTPGGGITIGTVFYLAQQHGCHFADADGHTKRAAGKQARENDSTQAKPQERLIQSSAEFIATFECPNPLIEGIIMRKFIYAITGHVSKGKTAAALLFAAHIGLGKMLGSLEVEQGRVLYLAGENYVDIQMRWIAMAQQMDFDPATIPVYFRPGRFKLSGKMDQLRAEVDELGGVDLIVVDGSTAFFEGDDENSNVQAGTHAVRLRELTTLKGEPGVLVLCHPPKNAGDDNLQPRGAGAMIAEWDGNLTATKDGAVTTIHWQIKIRGPDFAPLSFFLRTVTHERLVSKTGKLMPTVIAEPLSQAREEEMRKIARNEEDLVLEEIGNHPHSSQADIARHLGWLNQKGEIQKAKVHRIVKELKRQKLVEETRAGLSLTEKGNKAIKAKHGAAK
jgi:AAA domain/Primase C terminal 2 (PriCT-2)